MSPIHVRNVLGSRLLAETLRQRLLHETDLVVESGDGPGDVVLVDPDGPGWPPDPPGAPGSPRVVVVAADDDPTGPVAAARAGASAWLGRRSGTDELLQVVRGVVAGRAFFPRDAQADILRALRADTSAPGASGPLARLTGREREVLDALADGLVNREIGERLGLSYNTVRTHINEIFRKLGVHSRVDAVRTLEHMG